MAGNIHSKKEISCPVCKADGTHPFFETADVPVFCNVLCPTRQEALQVAKGDIRLGFCSRCGHIANLAFAPEKVEYSPKYENALHFSPHFQDYAEKLAKRLVERYSLRGKDIVEIACGDGTFLRLLCRLGKNRGIGFDPSYEAVQPLPDENASVRIIGDYYGEGYASYPADLICCRHALEHVPDPLEFVQRVRRSIEDRWDTAVYFEVPNMMYTLRDLGIWDLIYEHCSYFTPQSLEHCFTQAGFSVRELRQEYGGQFLGIEAGPRKETGEAVPHETVSLTALREVVESFGDEYRRKVKQWASCLERMQQDGRRAVLWGAGSKGVTFLNVFKDKGAIESVVDINPRKQGMFVAGTAQEIVGPEILRDLAPDVIIIMNPIYLEEIRQRVQATGIDAEFLVG